MKIAHPIFITSTLISISAPLYAADFLNETQAQKILFGKADRFVKLTVELSEEQLALIKEKAGVRQRSKSPQVWKAELKGELLGYFFIDEVIGKHEYITYALGVNSKGESVGIEIMSYRETHGSEIKDLAWRNKFIGKKLSDPFKLDKDVPNISGATLSCRNVLDGVKRLLVLHEIINNG